MTSLKLLMSSIQDYTYLMKVLLCIYLSINYQPVHVCGAYMNFLPSYSHCMELCAQMTIEAGTRPICIKEHITLVVLEREDEKTMLT